MYSPLISVCMPVYNAAPYLPEAIEGILAQTYENWELIVCDNQSTDSSSEIAKRYAHKNPKIRFYQNHWNIGFSGNAHKVTSLAQGDFIMLHAADDIAAPRALESYRDVINRFETEAQSIVLMSDFDVLGQDGKLTGTATLDYPTVKFLDKDSNAQRDALSEPECFEGHAILRDRLSGLRTFGWVGTVLCSRDVFLRTEGYINNQWVNPDKSFMFRALYTNPKVIWIKEPLFKYRLHDFNQNSQQRKSGVLKYLLDQYAYTFDLPENMLQEFANGREDLITQFVEHDCIRAALREIAYGNRKSGFRHLCFGLAAYPDVAWRNPKTYAAILLWMLGPLGTAFSRPLYRRYKQSNPERFRKSLT